MKNQPVSVTLIPWLKANLGKHCLAGLCSGELDALRAAVHIIACYAYSGDKGLLAAFGIVVIAMQDKERFLAYHAIAHVLDWPDRARVWNLAGLPGDSFGRCDAEPREVER